MTFYSACTYFHYQGNVIPSYEIDRKIVTIHPGRWRAMVRQILKRLKDQF